MEEKQLIGYLILFVILGAIIYDINTSDRGCRPYKPDPTVMTKKRREAIIKRLRRYD